MLGILSDTFRAAEKVKRQRPNRSLPFYTICWVSPRLVAQRRLPDASACCPSMRRYYWRTA